MDYEKLKEIGEKLQEFSEMEGTELGEYWGTLNYLISYIDYMNEGFEKAFEEEIQKQFEYVENNFEIVEEESVVKRVTKRLVDKNENISRD